MCRAKIVKEDHHSRWRIVCRSALLSLIIVWFGGCQSVNNEPSKRDGLNQREYHLQEITAERGKSLLSDLGLGLIASAADPNTLLVSGSPKELEKASAVLALVDTSEPYVIESLAPATMARTLPSNQQIAQAIGRVSLGTFAALPEPDASRRGIIDIQDQAVVAIVPADIWPQVRAIVEFGPEAVRLQNDMGTQTVEERRVAGASVPLTQENPSEHKQTTGADPGARVVSQLTEFGEPERSSDQGRLGRSEAPASNEAAPARRDATNEGVPEAVVANAATSEHGEMASRGVLKPRVDTNTSAPQPLEPAAVEFPDGDDIIELTLPEKINLAQLIDLVGEYLHLDCMYDAEQIGNQVITLKLHSESRSEITVKGLYSLLETILKSKELVMTRHEGNLASIVPAPEALTVDPELLPHDRKTIQPGDMVVTRIFELQHVEVPSVISLLQNMKLSIATSAIEDTQTLFVTCYAHRMARVEQLVHMVDKPGKPREFRFRRLRYTEAQSVAQKVLALADELQDIPITVAATASPEANARPSRRNREAPASPPPSSSAAQAVYLDTDERTNRILMIGCEAQLETVEGLIDILDVPQGSQPVLKTYEILYTSAPDVVQKLTDLGITDTTPAPAKGARPSNAERTGATAGARMRIIVLEATNSLLVNAAPDDHEQIGMVIDYIDTPVQDLRTVKVYDVQHADAEEVVRKLQALGFVGSTSGAGGEPGRITRPPATPGAIGGAAVDDLQMVVLEATNSLLVYTTDAQHDRLQAIIPYVDVEIRRERIPYEIYSLENQDPNQLADVLGRLVQETITDKEGKVQEVLNRTEDEIIIIPDAGTFSLIVYASRRNQEWIADLVERLDRRRPQVLIDVTLVEINKTEAFSYDLNLIESFPDLTATSGLTGTISDPVTSSTILNRLSQGGRSQFADYQSNAGDFTAFYGDKHINLLLQAMQSKNYGRILAKPKILVNDNQAGTIKTADTTYVAKRSSIPVSTGGTGNDATLIETAVDYQSYEAGITLNITPHTSQGELLRLDIELTRSDFREMNDEKPPDTTASELTTTVFVPDGSTIILGGLVKLNQNKGGAKVPLLGDIPLLGGLFRSINNSDVQNKLYVFVKAEIIHPGGTHSQSVAELEALSQKNRAAFETHENEFQNHQDWPGIKPSPIDPKSVLEAQ